MQLLTKKKKLLSNSRHKYLAHKSIFRIKYSYNMKLTVQTKIIIRSYKNFFSHRFFLGSKNSSQCDE